MAGRWVVAVLMFVGLTLAPTVASAEPAAPGYVGRVEVVSGTVGAVSYQVDLPQLGGGDPVVRGRFNSGMRAALDDFLKADGDGSVTITPGWLVGDEKSRVSHIGPGAVAGVLLLNVYYAGGAHPSNQVATTVIDAQTARPVLITDLFTDRSAGLTALADAVGVDPEVDQLANWVPSADGVVVYVSVSHAEGDYRAVTVPWAELAGVLVPGTAQRLGG